MSVHQDYANFNEISQRRSSYLQRSKNIKITCSYETPYTIKTNRRGT